VFSLFPRLRQLLLPGTAQPNDPAYVAGPDLPPCMQSRYSSATFFRPPNTVSLGIFGPPYMFRAQRKNLPTASNQFVEEGFLVYDGGTVCGFVVTQTWAFNNLLGSGNLQGFVQQGNIFTGGSGVTYGSQNIQYTDSTVEFGLSGNPGNTPVKFDGTSIGRGRRMWVASQNPTAAIGAEAAIMTSTVMTFYNNRAYQFEVDAAYFGSVANVALLRWRQGVGTGGTVLATAQHQLAGGGAGGETRFHDQFTLIRTAGSDLTDNVTVTLQSSAGTVTQQGSATQVRSFKISDAGDAADYNAANTI
jgi:hypothetical protein